MVYRLGLARVGARCFRLAPRTLTAGAARDDNTGRRRLTITTGSRATFG